MRIARFAFELAHRRSRPSVTLVHSALADRRDHTPDMGGEANTDRITHAIIEKLR